MILQDLRHTQLRFYPTKPEQAHTQPGLGLTQPVQGHTQPGQGNTHPGLHLAQPGLHIAESGLSPTQYGIQKTQPGLHLTSLPPVSENQVFLCMKVYKTQSDFASNDNTQFMFAQFDASHIYTGCCITNNMVFFTVEHST